MDFVPCPKCLAEGIETQLSEPRQTEEGDLVQDCPIHGRLYVLGAFRAEDGQAKDLLTGKSLPIMNLQS